MISKLFTLFVILPTIYAWIEIDISLNNDKERDVQISGSSVAMIGEMEKSAFGLNDEKLKKAVAVVMKAVPDNMYLNSPTPWGDLFATLKWEPIKMTFEPKKAEILSTKSEQVLVKSKDFLNENTDFLTLKIDMRQWLKNMVSSKWSKEGDLEVGDIQYNLNMNMPETEDVSLISHGLEDMEQSWPVNIGGVTELTLAPNQNLVAELYATAEHTVLRVDYEARLTGNVALNFDRGHKGHRFWPLDVNTLLTAGGMKKVLHSSEIIEAVHHTNARIVVKDAITNDIVYSALLNWH